MLVAGLDVGSAAAKSVVYDAAQRVVLGVGVLPTGWNPREAGEGALCAALDASGAVRDDLCLVVGTGYGRISLPSIDRKVTEITCHARGAAHLFPGASTVLDVGGQDSKLIAIEQGGAVRDFVMNDKCAAGTGRFLQVMTGVLGMTLDELGDAALRGEGVRLNSMCAVFAETEVIGLLAQGVPPEDIAAGVVRSVASRLKALTGRIPLAAPCVFTGGLATNPAFARLFSEVLDVVMVVPDLPQAAGALGAALIAADTARRGAVASPEATR